MSRGMKAGLAGLVLVGITWISREAWCAALGRFFTDGNLESGSAADFAVVPAADYIRPDVSIQTLEEVVRLQRTGSVKGILMSCPDYYGISECELAETALRNRGYPGVRFDWLRTKPLPDDIEAGQTVRWLAERGAKSASSYCQITKCGGLAVYTVVLEVDPQFGWRFRARTGSLTRRVGGGRERAETIRRGISEDYAPVMKIPAWHTRQQGRLANMN